MNEASNIIIINDSFRACNKKALFSCTILTYLRLTTKGIKYDSESHGIGLGNNLC